MKLRGLHIVILIVIAALLGYYFGVTKVSYEWKSYKPSLQVNSKEPPSTVQNVNFSTFWTVWDKLQTMYYDKTALDGQKLLTGAITGMVASLGDPYTVYLPPVQNTNFKQGLAGQFSGIGAELGLKDKDIVVVAPIDGSPAEKAGLKSGDIIRGVDGKSIAGWTLQQAVDKIRGEKGTKVTLTVVHKDTTKEVDIPIVRDTIQVKSVLGWVKKVKDIDSIKLKGHDTDAVAYIRLSQFGDNTNKEWIPVINQLQLDMRKNNAKGIILDLRNNPGGYLTDATFIASEFIDSGNVVIQDQGGEQTPFPIVRQGVFTKEPPLVVLINKGSASASEIVSGALRDHKRAELIGETSFGKGTIQQAEDFGGGAGLHVTIAKWLTPNGTWVGNGKDGKGLTPDIAVSLDPKDPARDTQLEKAVETLVK